MVYWYSAKDQDDEQAKRFQNVVLHDSLGMHYGRSLRAYKIDRAKAPDAFAAAGGKTTPALAVYDHKGKLKRLLDRSAKAKDVSKALRSVCADKSRPKR